MNRGTTIGVALSGCLACASLTGSRSEYEAYRRVRVAETVETRLVESQAYLRTYPRGPNQREVRAWFNRVEPKYFAEAKTSEAGLVRYLDHLPRGPHAEDATERLAELELARAYERRRAAELTEEGRALEEKLSDADRMRGRVVSEFLGWIRRLATLPKWHVRTHELPHEFIYHYRLDEPAARCKTGHCVKQLSFPYAIPDGGRLRARRALLDVELRLEEGGVAAATIRGPELFSRIAEAESVRPIRPTDSLARAEAIATVTTLVAGALEATHPQTDCAAETVAPVVLARQCRGLRIEVRAAPTAEQDDLVVVAPTP